MLTNELEGVNKDVYKTDWQWQEGEYTVTRTNMWTAPGCHNDLPGVCQSFNGFNFNYLNGFG